MSEIKIELPIHSRMLGFRSTLPVEIVDVAPHLAAILTFAVGPHPDDSRVWRLHNVETGTCISECDSPTKPACITAARKYLAAKTQHEAVRGLARFAAQNLKELPA